MNIFLDIIFTLLVITLYIRMKDKTIFATVCFYGFVAISVYIYIRDIINYLN